MIAAAIDRPSGQNSGNCEAFSVMHRAGEVARNETCSDDSDVHRPAGRLALLFHGNTYVSVKM
jgi:hypothetical protein